MTSNIRFDSMGVHKQILLDLFLSFGLSSDLNETVEKFVSELHHKLGLKTTAYISSNANLTSTLGESIDASLNYASFSTLLDNSSFKTFDKESIQNDKLKSSIEVEDEALIYQNSNNSILFLVCDKKKKLFQEKILEQLLTRFNFFISNIAFNQSTIHHQNSESQIAKEKSFLLKILDIQEQNIFVLDTNLVARNFNIGSKKALKNSFGVELEIGKKIFTDPKNEFDIKYKPLMERALNGEVITFNYSESNKNKNGISKHAVVIFKPIKDDNDQIIGVISTTKNVTELVETNRTLEKRESTLKTILDTTPDGIYCIDPDMKLLTINEQAKRDFKEYSKVDLQIGDNLHDKIDKEELILWKEKYFNRVFNNESFSVKDSMFNESINEKRFVENRYIPVKDSDNKIFAALEVSRDLTELSTKERILELKEAELRTLLEKTPIGIAKLNLKGKITFITKRTSNILGHSEEEILNKSIFDFVHPSNLEKFRNDIKKLLSGKDEVCSTYRAIHPKFQEFYLNGIASISRDSDNNPIEVLLAFNNISDEVIAQQNLLNSRKRYKSILEGSPAGLAQVNKEGKFIFVSKKGAEILNVDIDDLLNMNFLDLLDSKHVGKIKDDLDSLTESGQLIDFRIKVNSEVNKVLYLDGTATLLDDNELGMSTLFIFNDVTTRVLAEKELATFNAAIQEKNAIYKALIDNSFDGIDIIEIKKEEDSTEYDGEIVIRNERMNEYFSNSSKAFINLSEILEISPEYQVNGRKTSEVFNYLTEETTNSMVSCDWRFHIDDKVEDFHLSSNIISLQDKTLLIRNLRKNTELRRQQEIIKNQLADLSVKNKELEKYIQSNLQLENFAYIASHDLKAPLRTVSSFAFLLKQKAYEHLDDKSKGYLDIVLRSSTNMQKLIDDLLAFSRVGTQKVNYKDIILEPMLKRILLDLNSNIQETKAEIILKNLPDIIRADESMMIQVFLNLIGNALKFFRKDTHPQIVISAKENLNFWTFSIKDNGIGIREENKEKIFGIFEKLHSNDVFEGTGLGLSICKKVIDIHKGVISVDSELNKGSEFIFSIRKNLYNNE